MTRTVVHLLRHGEVHNPGQVLYGRLPGFRLSERGEQMARRVADHFTADGHDVARIVVSPLERTRQTAAPLAAALGLEPVVDERVIEAENAFVGRRFDLSLLRDPSMWRYFVNPFRPSWGEPFAEVAARMAAALADAREAAPGRETVVVSHQMPIWTARRAAEGRRLWHDPRRRQCALASVTSFVYEGDRLALLTYAEPAADLLPASPGVPGA